MCRLGSVRPGSPGTCCFCSPASGPWGLGGPLAFTGAERGRRGRVLFRKLLAGNGCFIVAPVASAAQREFYNRVPELNESFQPAGRCFITSRRNCGPRGSRLRKKGDTLASPRVSREDRRGKGASASERAAALWHTPTLSRKPVRDLALDFCSG